MKKIFVLLCVCCVALSGLSYAVEPDDTDSAPVTTEAPAASETVLDSSDPVDAPPESSVEDALADSDPESESDTALEGSVAESSPVVMGYSTYELSETEERTDSTVSEVVVSVFGEYQPVTHTVTDHLSDGSSVTYEQVVPGLAGVDWVWLSGVALFALMLYSLFRLLGVFMK